MAKRRVYGEGSITERKDGRWQVSVPGVDGKRRYAYADSEKEAEKLRRQLLAEVEAGKVPPSKQLFQIHVREWLEMKRKSKDYKPNSYINAVSRMDAHFVPAFGHIPLNKLTPSHIQKFYNKLLDDLSPNTIREYHQTLKSCLDSAVKQGKLESNPCNRVELPKKKKSKNNHLSQEEAMRLLEAIKGHNLFRTLVPLALATEARESELLALNWEDLDLERGVVRINKTLTREKDEQGHYSLVVVTPKSESGIRTIALPGFAIEALRSHKRDQMKQMMASGVQNKKNLVFCSVRGGYRWPKNVWRSFRQFAGRLELDITFHDLRHTGATLLLESDVSARVVQERLGHADISTTLRTYGHVTKRMEDKAKVTLDTLFTGQQNDDFEAV